MNEKEKNRQRKLEYKKKGLCVNCGRPRSNESCSKCDTCLDKDREYRRKKRDSKKEYNKRPKKVESLF